MTQSLPDISACDDCGTLRVYPKPLCPLCHGPNASPAILSGHGRVYSFSIIHRAPNALLAADAPYTIALIDLIEGPRLPARVLGDIACGDPVILIENDSPYPVFQRLR